ncbi:MAG: ABC transporter permease subunit [Acidimicrobiia bacterium]|nr:ABC transporter permease subunit [Acidimicrobiia bacterium]
MDDTMTRDGARPWATDGSDLAFRRPVVLTARSRTGVVLKKLLPVISIATFLVILEIIGRLELSSVVPPVTEAVGTFFELLEGGHLEQFTVSLQALGMGFGLALVLGLAVGTLTTVSRTLDYVLEPYINGFMSMPTSALIPVLMLIFGLGQTTRVVVVFLYAFFMIVVNTQAGLRQVDPAHAEMARAFGAKGTTYLRFVTIPTALPLILTGLRLGVSRALKGMINSETIISVTGIGALIIRFGRTFDVSGLYAVILIIIVMAVLLTSLIRIVETKTGRWLA